MLTEEETAELRGKVGRSAARDGDGIWFRYADGPLNGLLARLTPDATQYLHGWCHLTRTGAVVALYTADTKTKRCHFHRYSQPGSEGASW